MDNNLQPADLNQVNLKKELRNFLGVRNVWNDFKELPNYFKILIGVSIIIILFFNFFNTSGSSAGHEKSFFMPVSQYWSALDPNSTSIFGHSKSGAIAVAVLWSLNGLSSFTGILAVSMMVHGKTSQYFWGIINAVFFGLFALSTGFLGGLIMQIILILGAPLGWYLFEVKRLAYKEDKKENWKQNLLFFIYAALAITLVTLIFYEFLPTAAYDMFKSYPYGEPGSRNKTMLALDSVSTGFNIVGYGMQLTNMGQQFYLWVILDVIKIFQFSGIAGKHTLNINTLIEFGVWTLLASIGLYKRNFRSFFERLIQNKKAASSQKAASATTTK